MKIVAVFKGLGKTTVCESNNNVIDLSNSKDLHNDIVNNLDKDYILVGTDKLKELSGYGYTIVFPDGALSHEYINRLKYQGYPKHKLRELFYGWIEMQHGILYDEIGTKIVVGSSVYLSDVLFGI